MELEDAVPLPEAAADAAEKVSVSEEDDMSESGDYSDDEEEEEEERRRQARVPRQREEEPDEEDVNAFAAAMASGGGQASAARRGGIGTSRSMGGIGSAARATASSIMADIDVKSSGAPSSAEASAAAVSSTAAGSSAVGEGPSPSTSAAPARERRSFLTGGGSNSAAGSRSGTPTPGLGARKAPAPISKEEQKHFDKLASKGGFAYKMMQKMGWSAGSGLGASGEGMVTPIESKLRPKAMGLAYDGFKERTKQSKAEQKRQKGGTASDESDDDSDSGPGKRKGKGKGKGRVQDGASSAAKSDGPPAWKQPKPRKPKVHHMSYEEIVAQQQGGSTSTSAAGVGAIYDLSGNQLSAASLSGAAHIHDVPTSDGTRLPELRHNLAIILDGTKGDLDNLAREGVNVNNRRTYMKREEARVQQTVKIEAERIARLEVITQATMVVQELSTSLSANDGRPVTEQLAIFGESFDNLLSTATGEEYEAYRLDEVVVGAIAPTMKRAWSEWNPLESPTAHLDDLKQWRRMYRLQKRDATTSEDDARQIDLFGAASYGSSMRTTSPRTMTAFESLLWTLWLPRVRSAINNEWNPLYPAPVIALFAGWKNSGLVPRFMSDNILDQLVLPKLKRAIESWMPPRRPSSSSKASGKDKKDVPSLHHIVFPWLEHAGERMDEIVEESKRRVRGWLKSWRARDGVPDGLAAWREVIPKTEWDNLVLQHVVPQLSVHLREKFTVNPRAQDLTPLSLVLSWRPLLRSSILSQILETEFFPRLLDALHTWLVAPGVNYEQVADWYRWWRKEVFSTQSGCDNLPSVEKGFAKALDLMNQAMSMGEDVKYYLKKPDTRSGGPSTSANGLSRDLDTTNGSKSRTSKPKQLESSTGMDVTFRSVVEEMAAENNLLFIPTGKSHEVSGMPTFRVSSSIDGKLGITVYLQGDVLYAQTIVGPGKESWKPISVQDMVERAQKGGTGA